MERIAYCVFSLAQGRLRQRFDIAVSDYFAGNDLFWKKRFGDLRDLRNDIQAFARGIIIVMEVGNIRLYRERWKAVEEIEQQELRAMSPEEHWQKLNAIVRFAIEAGMEKERDDGEMEVFLRWAKLKARYEARQKP